MRGRGSRGGPASRSRRRRRGPSAGARDPSASTRERGPSAGYCRRENDRRRSRYPRAMGSDRGKRVAHVGVTRHGAPPAPAGPDDPTSKPGAPGVGVGNADDTMPAESAPDSAEARGASARPAAGATAPPPTPPTEPRPSGSISRYQFGPELG